MSGITEDKHMAYIGFLLIMVGLAAAGGAIDRGDSLIGEVAMTAAGAVLMWLIERRMRTVRKRMMALVLAAAVLWTSLPVRAEEDVEKIRSVEAGKVFPILTTAYCHGRVTAMGGKPRRGICAVREEWIGKTALVWEHKDSDTMGEFLGYWECLDTGFGADSDGDGMGSIQEGRVIDMYFPTPEEVQEWMEITGGKVYVQLIDAEG